MRPDDRHPISRFLEPHFIDARHALGVHECAGCHLEHQGKRVTLPTIGICTHCHEETALQDDPIAPTHAELVRADEWNTCLRCHDFHGNHPRDTPTRLAQSIPEATVRAYFDGAPSPYAKRKYMKARLRNAVEVPAEELQEILRRRNARQAAGDAAAPSAAGAAP